MARRPPSSIRKDNFRQRNRTIKKKANLARSCGAQAYIVVFLHGQFHTFTSHDTSAWALCQDQTVRNVLRVTQPFTDLFIGPELSSSKESRTFGL